jgi:transposase InsO family protein
MIRDRDRVYGAAVTRRLRAMSIRDKPVAPGSPWQNGFAERLIGSIRRECVDHIVVLGEAHLPRILTRYAAYYNKSRTHRSLGKDAPTLAVTIIILASVLRMSDGGPGSAPRVLAEAPGDYCSLVDRRCRDLIHWVRPAWV